MLEAMEKLFTEDEVIGMSGHYGVDTANIARAMYYASVAEYSSRKNESDPIWVMARALQNVFEAGRLQGIRQERARRKKQ